MRAMNLANTLIIKGHNVVIWSSGFYHQKKIQSLKKKMQNFKTILSCIKKIRFAMKKNCCCN
jgi:hypothetical protein